MTIKKSILSFLGIALWLLWITASLFLIRWLISNFVSSTPAFISSGVALKCVVIYLYSLPLTLLVACKGKFKEIKTHGQTVVILILLTAFLFYAFYQWQFAYLGSSNLSYDNVYGFGQMTAFEYNLYYAENVKAFYIVSLIRTLLGGLMLSAVYLIFRKLTKKNLE